MKHFVYILQSLGHNRCYVGYTIDLERRLLEHNLGNTRSTRPFGPWRLIHFEEYDDKSAAYKREWHLKHPAGYKEKLQIIKRYGEVVPHSPRAKQALVENYNTERSHSGLVRALGKRVYRKVSRVQIPPSPPFDKLMVFDQRANEANALNEVEGQHRKLNNMKFFTYIILCNGGKYYVGHSSHVDRRFERHLHKNGAKFTAQNVPIEILWKQEFNTEIEAIRREKQIKGWNRAEKENLIKGVWK